MDLPFLALGLIMLGIEHLAPIPWRIWSIITGILLLIAGILMLV